MTSCVCTRFAVCLRSFTALSIGLFWDVSLRGAMVAVNLGCVQLRLALILPRTRAGYSGCPERSSGSGTHLDSPRVSSCPRPPFSLARARRAHSWACSAVLHVCVSPPIHTEVNVRGKRSGTQQALLRAQQQSWWRSAGTPLSQAGQASRVDRRRRPRASDRPLPRIATSTWAIDGATRRRMLARDQPIRTPPSDARRASRRRRASAG